MTSEMTHDDLIEMECDELRTQRLMTDEEREANLAELAELLGMTRPREAENAVRFMLGFMSDEQVEDIHLSIVASLPEDLTDMKVRLVCAIVAEDVEARRAACSR